MKSFKKHLSVLVSSNRFRILIISIIFFFAWSDLMIDTGPAFTRYLDLSNWSFIILGILFPVLLLIGIVQYHNCFAYAMSFLVFVLTIYTNLSVLPYYLKEYEQEQNGAISNCSCCVACEIRAIGILVFFCALAIVWMSRRNTRKMVD